MTLYDIKFAELPLPLFLGGVNFGLKLDPVKRTGLKIQHDPESRRVFISYNGHYAVISENNVVLTPANITDYGFTPTEAKTTTTKAKVTTTGPHAMKTGISKTAQVSDPSRGMK